MQQSVQQRAVLPPRHQKKISWFDQLTVGTGHGFYRLISLASSIASAYAIFWYLGGYSDDWSQKIFAGALCLVFVVIGYVTVRNIAHRLKDKQMLWSYVPLLVLFLCIEVGANLAHGLSFAQTAPWLREFRGQQRLLFQQAVALSIASLPLLNIFLAAVEVDLMRQKIGSDQLKQLVPPVPVPVTNKSNVQPKVVQPVAASQQSQTRAVPGAQQQQSVQRPAGPPRQQQQPNGPQRQAAASVPAQGAAARQFGAAKNGLQGYFQGVRDEGLSDEELFDVPAAMP